MKAFTQNSIKNIAASSMVYSRGVNMKRNIVNFQYNAEKNVIFAVVRGIYHYEVSVFLDEKGAISRYYCDCEEFLSNDGACKHIVAVMEYAMDKLDHVQGQTSLFNDTEVIELRRFVKDKETFLELSDLGVDFSGKKDRVRLWIEQSFATKSNSSPYLTLSLKIGLNKPYVVRNIATLLDAIENNKPVDYGKNFSFDPSKMEFKGMDKEVIHFLLELYKREIKEKTILSSHRYYYYGSNEMSIFDKSTVLLFEDNLKRYFEIVKNANLMVNFGGGETHELKISDDLDIEIKLREEDGSIIMEANYSKEEKIAPLTEDYEYVYNPYKFAFYKVSAEKAKLLGKIHQIRQRRREPVFKIQKNDQERFFRGFYNEVKDWCKVSVTPELNEKIVEDVLVSKVYFDVIKKGVCARVDFCYGEKIINAFMPDTHSKDPAVVIRDYEYEAKVMDFLMSAGMIQKDGLAVLENEEEIVELLNDKIHQLKELAEVYYSEEFKKIQIKNIRNVQLGVRLNTDSNLLEVDFQVDEFNDDELRALLYSVKEKKKYYRLKNGSIIQLDNNELAEISRLMDDLSVDAGSFKDGILNLPSNRAMFIDNFVQERQITGIRKDEKFERLVREITNPKDLTFEIDGELSGILREYQKFGYQWLKTLSYYGFGGILADDMGLGKTLQVLTFIKDELKSSKNPCLVVAPTSLVYNWKAEVEKFIPQLRVNVIHGTKAERLSGFNTFDDSDIIVTSYGSMKRDIDLYKEKEFSYIFVDEAQHIKNPNTLNASSVKSLKAKGYFALTGTPIENSLTELWSIFDFIMPGYLMNHNKFVNKFEKPIVRDNDKEVLKTLSGFIKPFVLRRIKKDVLKELPEKIESKVVCDMTSNQKKLYAAYLQKAKGEIAAEIQEKGIEKSKIKILAALTRLRQICCHPGTFVENYKDGSGKLESLLEILEDSVGAGHKVLVFSQFTSMHEIIRSELNKAGIPYFYLDGSTDAKDRMEMVNRFNNKERPIFLISLKAGGTGLNLTGADMVIHYDPWWNPAVEDQATDRAYRIGQTKAVQVYKLITQGTIEEKIFALQDRKRELINSVIRPGENLLTKLGEKEIRELFQM